MTYTLSNVRAKIAENWKAGLTVALISVPLSIALSIASGAGPIPGIITAVWATGIAALFCSSSYNIIGPAGALTTILFAAAFTSPLGLGPAILPILAIFSGIFLFLIWLAGLDRFLYYIPSSVMYGFAAGVAVLIAVSQLFDAAGLSTLQRTGSFLGDVGLFASNLPDIHIPSIGVFAAFFVGILIFKRVVPQIPAVIPAAILGIAFGYIESSQFDLQLISLGEKFGSIDATLFQPLSFETFKSLLMYRDAFSWILKTAGLVALVSVLETLITAKIGDKLTRTQSSARREIFGLSLANIGSGLMGGLPATGVFIRTGANIKAGATHRTSAFLSAVFTALIALLVLPFFVYLPAAVIAAILVNTALGLLEIHRFKEFWRYEKESFVVAVLVAGITVIEDASIAVLVGAVVALLIFSNRMSRGRFNLFFNFADGTKEEKRATRALVLPEKTIDVLTYSIAGYLGYIDSGKHAENFRIIAHARNVKKVIIRLRDLYSVDFEGYEMLRDAIEELHQNGKVVAISSAKRSIARELRQIPTLTKHIQNDDYSAKTTDVLGLLKSA